MGTIYLGQTNERSLPYIAQGKVETIMNMKSDRFPSREDFLAAQRQRISENFVPKITPDMKIDSITVDLDKKNEDLTFFPFAALAGETTYFKFQRMEKLQNLNGFPATTVTNIPENDKIRILTIDDVPEFNSIEGMPSDLPKLQQLEIKNAPKLQTLEHFPFANNLKEITIRNAGLTTLKHLRSLRNVTDANFSENNLTDLEGIANINGDAKIDATKNPLRTLYGITKRQFYNLYKRVTAWDSSEHVDSSHFSATGKRLFHQCEFKPTEEEFYGSGSVCNKAYNYLSRSIRGEYAKFKETYTPFEELTQGLYFLFDEMKCSDKDALHTLLEDHAKAIQYKSADQKAKHEIIIGTLRTRFKQLCDDTI